MNPNSIFWTDVKLTFECGGGSNIIIKNPKNYFYNGDVIVYDENDAEALEWLNKHSTN